MKRRTWLRRLTALTRRTPLRRVNPERQKRREEAGQVYGPYHRYVKTLPCILAGRSGHTCWGPVTGHHVKTVGAGGLDERNEVPCCVMAHREIHAGARGFEREWGIDLVREATRMHERWERLVGG